MRRPSIPPHTESNINSVKRGTLILLLASIAALIGYGVFYNCATAHSRAMLNMSQGELEWLREEFDLDNDQFATIQKLHNAHVAQCKELCQKVDANNANVLHLTAMSNQVTPEIKAALDIVAISEANCRAAMLAHIFTIAAQMPPQHRQQYIDMMTAHIAPAKAAHHEQM